MDATAAQNIIDLIEITINSVVSDINSGTDIVEVTKTNIESDEIGARYKYSDVSAMTGVPGGVRISYDIASSSSEEFEDAFLETHMDVVATAIEKTLTSNGYTKLMDDWTVGFYGNEFYYNSASDVICEVDIHSMPSDMTCSITSWISDEKKELVNGFAAALGSDGTAYIDFVGSSVIQDSEIEPYQTAGVLVGNGVGLFYRASEDSPWVYVTGGHTTPSCAAFTGDAAKAFYGRECVNYSDESHSTVGAQMAIAETSSNISVPTSLPEASANIASVETPAYTVTPNTGVFPIETSAIFAGATILAAFIAGTIIFKHKIARKKQEVHFVKY